MTAQSFGCRGGQKRTTGAWSEAIPGVTAVTSQEVFKNVMKKAFLLILMVLLAVGITMAQTYTLGSGLTGIDKLGAHENGGRVASVAMLRTAAYRRRRQRGTRRRGRRQSKRRQRCLVGTGSWPTLRMVITQGDNGQVVRLSNHPSAPADFSVSERKSLES